MGLQVTSPAFKFGEPIPPRHTKEGEDVSPPLEWSGVPNGTRQLAVICHDPDAPMPDGFTHWVVYGIPADTTSIPEGGGDRFTQGEVDFGGTGYGGCKPPEGHGPHHYYFWVYALDTEVTEGSGMTRRQFIDRYGDHILDQNRLVGTYER